MIHVFIVNPICCEAEFAGKLRAKLEKIPDLNYYVFSTRREGHEKDLVELILRYFDNEELRFYACGGSGTLRNMLCAFKDMKRAEVAMIPYGSCDFLKVFTDEPGYFRNIDAMIGGEVVYVDYIESNLGVALNSVSFGADTDLLKVGEDLKSLGIGRSHFPYTIASIYASLFATNKSYDIKSDGVNVSSEKVTLMYFGNGSVIGGRFKLGINDIVDDGMGSYFYLKGKALYARFKALRCSARGEVDKLSKWADIGSTKHISARRTNGSSFYVELDGELTTTTELEAHIVRQGLKFVIPKRGV
ncbi:MAG: hypothetical protein K5669_11865 [Lachnospiraceae bacterium]|nr:hypothetical protein [Lachnospiraceae bacterium]